jgi:hypothetical protein
MFAQLAHSDLSGAGSNSHSTIDTHLGDATKHRQINDSGTSNTDLFSAAKILQLVADINTAVTGSLIYKGGYDASTNTPKLAATPIAITQGWTYVVTTGGNFFTEAVQPGDMIIAKQTTPTTLAHWTVVNKNIPDIVAASEATGGVIQIATQAEVNAGTDDTKAVTPLKLKTTLGVTGTLSVAKKYTQTIGDGTALTYAVTHNLNCTTVVVSVHQTLTPFHEVQCEVVKTSNNVTTFNFNAPAPASNQYTVVIIG